MNKHASSPQQEHGRVLRTLTPATDIVAHKDHYHISIAMPGAQRDAIEVEHHRGMLSVSAETQLRPEQGRPLLEECARVRWQRSFQLSDDCDHNSISAHYENGILDLHIAKAADRSPKNITVQ